MDKTKKQQNHSIDFHNVLRGHRSDPSIKTPKIFSLPKTLLSLRNYQKAGIYFLKRLKKIFYKQFFWGRGGYYKISVAVMIVLISTPIITFASSINSQSNSNIFQDSEYVYDTAFDVGNGKTAIPSSKTINSIQTYIVQKGDTISSIASKFEISEDALKYTNKLTSDTLKIGQELQIVPYSGILYTVAKGDTLESIAKKFDITKDGYSAQVILDVNLLDSVTLVEGQKLLVPGAKIENTKPVVAQKPRSTVVPVGGGSNYNPPPGLRFIGPTAGFGRISTCYSAAHPAIDIATMGTYPPLYASAAGTVVWAGYGLSGGSGIAVAIKHADGYQTEYLHMSKISVNKGDVVKQGQLIGYVGSTGRSTGPHVHFIIKLNGVNQNPFKYIDFSNLGRETRGC